MIKPFKSKVVLRIITVNTTSQSVFVSFANAYGMPILKLKCSVLLVISRVNNVEVIYTWLKGFYCKMNDIQHYLTLLRQ